VEAVVLASCGSHTLATKLLFSVKGFLYCFDVLTSIVPFYTGPQSIGGVAYGVTSLQANRNTVTKASRRGIAT
jgi:hypothetical protein